MQPGQYPTSGDARVFIDGQWVDDTLRVDFTLENRKVPLHGYHQKFYGDVADGKVLVSGNLAIHFRWPGYLMAVIDGILRRRELTKFDVKLLQQQSPGDAPGAVAGPPELVDQDYEPYVSTGLGVRSAIEAINQMRRMTPQERIEFLLKQENQGAFDRSSAILNAMFEERANPELGEQTDPQADPVQMGPAEFAGGHAGFDVEIYYAKTEDTTGQHAFYVREVLKGVHLTGNRKVISAAVGGSDLGGSGQSILEVYPFFARKIERYTVNDRPPIVPSATSVAPSTTGMTTDPKVGSKTGPSMGPSPDPLNP